MEKQSTIAPPITDKKTKKMIAVLRKVGLDEDACARTMRLLSAAPTLEEKRRWQQIGLMEGDRIVVTDEERGGSRNHRLPMGSYVERDVNSNYRSP